MRVTRPRDISNTNAAMYKYVTIQMQSPRRREKVTFQQRTYLCEVTIKTVASVLPSPKHRPHNDVREIFATQKARLSDPFTFRRHVLGRRGGRRAHADSLAANHRRYVSKALDTQKRRWIPQRTVIILNFSHPSFP